MGMEPPILHGERGDMDREGEVERNEGERERRRETTEEGEMEREVEGGEEGEGEDRRGCDRQSRDTRVIERKARERRRRLEVKVRLRCFTPSQRIWV